MLGDWQQVKEILAEALEREPGERPAYLEKVCHDPFLRREVESLLAAHEEAPGTFLQCSAVDAASLDTGTDLGHYRIAALLGAGGMGEVYQAHDIQLGRDVAIKILPPPFVHDAERLARFQREARTLASLNHPNIATIYGLEQCGEKGGDYVLWGNLGDGHYWNPAKRTQAMDAYRQAIVLGFERLSVNPKDQGALGTLAICYAMLGEKRSAMNFLRQGLKLDPRNPGTLFKAALVYNQFGDASGALMWLGKALDAGYSPTIVRDSPNFELLRSDPRFPELTHAK
jgi:tetratricopeptide (TPR) repeat protein